MTTKTYTFKLEIVTKQSVFILQDAENEKQAYHMALDKVAENEKLLSKLGGEEEILSYLHRDTPKTNIPEVRLPDNQTQEEYFKSLIVEQKGAD